MSKTTRTAATLAGLLAAGMTLGANQALLVGVGDYDGTVPDLPGIGYDLDAARQMALWLGVPDSNITVLSDAEATSERVARELERMADRTGSGDVAFFYYSGHGSNIDDAGGDESDGLDEVLVTHDVEVTGPRGARTLRGVLVDDELSDLFARFDIGRLLVAIDACNSGTAADLESARSIGATRLVEKFFEYRESPLQQEMTRAQSRSIGVTEGRDGGSGFLSLSASRDDESALATEKGSLFTLGLHAGFFRAAGGELDGNALHDAASEFISTALAGSRKTQTPQIHGNRSSRWTVNVPGNDGRLRTAMLDLVSRGGLERLAMEGPGRVALGRELQFRLEPPPDGLWYLNVISVGPIDNGVLLFPNQRFPDNRVDARGGQITIGRSADSLRDGRMLFPHDAMARIFTFTAQEPLGDTLTIAVWTAQPVNFFESGTVGAGGKPLRDESGRFEAQLAGFGSAEMGQLNETSRSIGLSGPRSSAAGYIGHVEITTTR